MRVAKPFEGSDIRGLDFCLPEGPSTQLKTLYRGQFVIAACSSLTFVRTALWVKARPSQLTPRSSLGQNNYLFSKIRVKGILDRCRDALAANALDSDTDPDFAKRFLLHCEDDAEKHRFFTRSKLLHIRQWADDFRIQSSPDWLLMFHPSGKVSDKKLRQFVDVTSTIAFGLLDFEPRVSVP